MEFLRHLRQGGKITLLLCLFVVGAALLFWDARSSKENDKTSDTRIPGEDVKQALEEELTRLILEMDGIHRASVSVTLESGNEFVYENGQNTKVFAEKVRGVAVVCNNGNDPVTKERILSMICSLFDLPLRAVSVCE